MLAIVIFHFSYTAWLVLVLLMTELKYKNTKCPVLLFMPSLMKIRWWIFLTFMPLPTENGKTCDVKKWMHFIYLFMGCICCRARKDELDGEVFDVLFTFSDFTAFKEMFLDYKAVSNSAHVSEKFRARLWTNDNDKVKCLALFTEIALLVLINCNELNYIILRWWW